MALKNLSMDMLRSFVTVSEYGRFTYAADKLGRSQPAISIQVKRLEELLGTELMCRRASSVELTHAGQYLVDYAKKILALNDEVLGGFSVGRMNDSLALGVSHELSVLLLPQLFSFFSREYPKINFEVSCGYSHSLLADAPKTWTNYAIGLQDPEAGKGGKVIKEVDLVWVAGLGVDKSKLTNQPLIFAPRGCFYRDRVAARLKESGIRWDVIHAIPDFACVRSMVKEGMGISVMARECVTDDLTVLEPSVELPNMGRACIAFRTVDSACVEVIEKLEQFLLSLFKAKPYINNRS